MSWDYRIEETALRDLSKLGTSVAGEVREYLNTRIRRCADPTRFGKPLRGSRHGLWRYRVRDWRIVCKLEKSVLTVVVIAVGHRSTVYDD